MPTDDTIRAFYEGKDAGPHDPCSYPPDTALWRAWLNGHMSEWAERTPMSDAEVEAAFAAMNKRRGAS
ncbi:MAG TPA: hypothetical protein VF913_12455 [Xanthobacteraceae bacterium]